MKDVHTLIKYAVFFLFSVDDHDSFLLFCGKLEIVFLYVMQEIKALIHNFLSPSDSPDGLIGSDTE